jgi:phosphoribosyl-ATP pyrophosphohydrolase
MSGHILEQLYKILQERKGADPKSSYAASLYAKGTQKITEKVLEEAAEAVEEALKGDKERLKEESADLLFHLMVLWADQGVVPEDVFAVLEKRLGTSGHAEKASRLK